MRGLAYPRSLGSGGKLVVVLLYLGVYLRDALRATVGDALPLAALALGLALGSIYIFARLLTASGAGISRTAALALGVAVACWVVGVANAGRAFYSSYLFAVPLAFIILHSDPRFFFRVAIAHVLLSIVIQLWEYRAGTYLFTIVDEEGVELSAELFAGATGVTRTKGLFPGPLSAVAFSFWIAFFLRRSVWGALALVACAYLASGRLGMVVGSALLLWRLLSGATDRKAGAVALVIFALLTAQLILGADTAKLDFLMLAFDPTSGNNASRVFFWAAALSEYLNYPAMDMLFGRFGYIKGTDIYPESDFLQLLLDHGILGCSLYVFALARLFAIAVQRRDAEGLVVATLLVAIMNVFPLVQSLFSSIFFWLYILLYERRWVMRGAGLNSRGRPEKVVPVKASEST